jgi:hypothetical protein
MRKIVTVAAGLVAAVGIASGSAGAQPGAEEAVGFTAHATDTQSIITTDAVDGRRGRRVQDQGRQR